LTDQHLKDLGIALGDRLKMFRAIRELAGAVPASPQPAPTEPKPQDSADMIGHRLLGNTLLCIGDVADGLAHLDRAIALYDPAVHRPLATRFAQDIGVAIQACRPVALWLLGYLKTALAEVERALRSARDAGHAGTLMFTLQPTTFTQLWCGNYAAANAQVDDLISLADEKGAVIWKMLGTVIRGASLALTGKTPEAFLKAPRRGIYRSNNRLGSNS
jgi:tetratricopeptide (TPR) repeat protein